MRTTWLLTALLAPAVLGAQTVTTRGRTAARPSRAKAPARLADAPARAMVDSAPAAPAPVASPATLAAGRRTALLTAPDGGGDVAELAPGARVTTVARDRGWVRVQVDGWVRAADLAPVDSTTLTTVSAADLRAEPDKFRGQTVRWQVQMIAFQTADPLRKDMAPDEPYLLARGPGGEGSLLYLALPPSLVEQGKQLEPLSTFIVTARVRAGRSTPSGVPLLDVIAIAPQR